MATLTYFINTKYFGKSDITHDSLSHNIAYFCPSCGDIWARVVSDKSSYWHIETVSCEKHEPKGMAEWARIPGCLSLPVFFEKKNLAVPFWGRAIDVFPEAVLKRELTLLLDNYERRIDNEQ